MDLDRSKYILIIGGNGFIGSHLADLLLKMNLQVRILDKYPERYRNPLPGVDYRLGDFDDESLLKESLINTEFVFNLASSSVPANSNNNCACDIQSNLIPSIKLLDLMVQQNCRKVIFLSSGGAVYGNPIISPTPENTVLRPISSYGVIKATVENYIGVYSHLHNLQFLIIRPSNLYGLRQASSGLQGLIITVFDSILNNKKLNVWGNGESIRDYLHVSDLMTFIQKALLNDIQGIYNVGSGIGYSVNFIINLISGTSGFSPKINYLLPRTFDVNKIILDISKANTMLDWQPVIDIYEGIAGLWSYFKEQGINNYKS